MSVSLPPGIIHHFQSEHNAPAHAFEVVRASTSTSSHAAASFSYSEVSAVRAATQSKLENREAQLVRFQKQVQSRLRAKQAQSGGRSVGGSTARTPLSPLRQRMANVNAGDGAARSALARRSDVNAKKQQRKSVVVTAATRQATRKAASSESRAAARSARVAKSVADRKRAARKEAKEAARDAAKDAVAARAEATRRERTAAAAAAAAQKELMMSLRRGGGRTAPVGTPSPASRSTSRATAIKARRVAANAALSTPTSAPCPRSSPPPPPTPTQSAVVAAALRTAKRESNKQRSAARYVEGLRKRLLQRVGKVCACYLIFISLYRMTEYSYNIMLLFNDYYVLLSRRVSSPSRNSLSPARSQSRRGPSRGCTARRTARSSATERRTARLSRTSSTASSSSFQ